jgi:S-formylglutathione hydrolase FrmB
VIRKALSSFIRRGSQEVRKTSKSFAPCASLIAKSYVAISDNFWLIGEDKAINPKEYFIIIPAFLGNGQSSSSSNHSSKPFPHCAFHDNVRAQLELLTRHFNIKHVRAVLGWSVGACQAYQWATQYPDFMDIIVPWCGAARTSLHNQLLLEGVKSSLIAAKGISSAGSKEGGTALKGQEIRTWSQEEKEAGLKTIGRANAGL